MKQTFKDLMIALGFCLVGAGLVTALSFLAFYLMNIIM